MLQLAVPPAGRSVTHRATAGERASAGEWATKLCLLYGRPLATVLREDMTQWLFLWYRLNGTRQDSIANCLPEGLPFPASTKEARQSTIQSLRMDVDGLEKKLQEASKVAILQLAFSCSLTFEQSCC